MNPQADSLHIPDTQSERDERHLAIQRVGVKDVRYPLTLKVAGAEQSTAALWSLDVALPAEQKGTHMSRFVAWLDAQHEPMDAALLSTELAAMLAAPAAPRPSDQCRSTGGGARRAGAGGFPCRERFGGQCRR